MKWKRRLSYITIAAYYFISGVEYAVILPTIWLYLKMDFHAEPYMLGLLMSGYSFSAILSGPLLGRWSDKFHQPKIIMVAGAMFEVAGNFMYFLGLSVWFLLVSRLVAGIGGGAEAVLLAEVTRNSPEEKRTGLISLLVAIRQTGLLVGPGLNLFLREIDFTVYHFHVNKYNIPGAFMACVWILQVIVILFLYTDLQKLKKMELAIQKSGDKYDNIISALPQATINSAHRPICTTRSMQVTYDDDVYSQPSQCLERNLSYKADNLMERAESYIVKCPNMSSTNVDATNSGSYFNQTSTIEQSSSSSFTAVVATTAGDNYTERISFDDEDEYEKMVSGERSVYDASLGRIGRKDSQGSQEYILSTEETLDDYLQGRSRWRFFYQEYIREEIITVIAVQFNSYFNQVALETMVTPLTNTLLGWGELENSILFCLAGVEIIFVFLLVTWLSKRLQDRTLILIGSLVLSLATAWLLYVVPRAKPDDVGNNLWKFIISLVLDMFALPFLVASSISLYSKITRKETQGLSMGIRRSVVGMATIIAPLWAGSALSWPYVMFGVMLGLLLLSLVMLCTSYTKLRPISEMPANQAGLITASDSEENQERRPLLS